MAVVGMFGAYISGVPSSEITPSSTPEQIKSYIDAVISSQGSIQVIGSNLLAIAGIVVALVGRIKADTIIE